MKDNYLKDQHRQNGLQRGKQAEYSQSQGGKKGEKKKITGEW